MSKGYVKEVSGLGNTLKTLVSVMRFYPTGYATDSPSLMHVLQGIPLVTNENLREYELYWGWQLILHESEKDLVKDLSYMMPVVGTTGFHRVSGIIDMQYEKIPDVLWDSFMPVFQKLMHSHIRPEIKDNVFNFSRDWNINNKNVVSMHVRSWMDEPLRHAMFYNEDFYINEIRKLPGDTRVYLATDSNAFAHKLDTLFPDRILLYPRQHRNSHSFHTRRRMDYEEALIEMLLLAQNKTIIGSVHSTFTEVAYYFARCIHDSEVKIILQA